MAMQTRTDASRGATRIGILSCAGDLHSLLIQRALRLKGAVCDVIETDAISGSRGLTWEDGRALVPTREQELVDPGAWDVLWSRRINYPQLGTKADAGSPASAIINNDCKAALLGAIKTSFRGLWIDAPASVQAAENKLYQLHVAKIAGLRIPETVVTQDPERVRAFADAHPEGVIVKTVRGTSTHPLLALRLLPEMLLEDHPLRISPACYQQYIPGRTHLRVNCFGEETLAFAIESDPMDWRQNLNIPIRRVVLECELEDQLRRVLQLLDLSMGIFDLKVDDRDGQPVWLEINPQGQFLFLEGLTGVDLIQPFTMFLLDASRGQGISARQSSS